ncbi:hypothetical protein Mapa_001798 [Marchantia paleacea]|nr:hypothetical protein Mapa_001798 [Marchantia paleacea]
MLVNIRDLSFPHSALLRCLPHSALLLILAFFHLRSFVLPSFSLRITGPVFLSWSSGWYI